MRRPKGISGVGIAPGRLVVSGESEVPEGAVKRENFGGNFPIGEMFTGEKVGSLSVVVEKYYVNRNV